RIPWIYTAAVGSYGATMNIVPGVTACLACLFPEPPTGMVETCDTSGILNSAVQAIAAIAATEAIKLLSGAHAALRRTLLALDVWQNTRTEVAAAAPNPECRCCGRRDFVHLAGDARPHITLCGRNSVQL